MEQAKYPFTFLAEGFEFNPSGDFISQMQKAITYWEERRVRELNESLFKDYTNQI
jgi:hypothetical protein